MLTIGKSYRLQQCATPDGQFVMFALDHRGNLRRSLNPEAPETGVNVIQFERDRTISHQWYYVENQNTEDDVDAVDSFIFTPWDWRLDDEGDEDMFVLSDDQIKHLDENINWTHELHVELEEKWPSETHWE